MSAVRFGLAGSGHWASVTHAPALATAPGVDFVGVWGRDPAKAAIVAERHGVRAFANLDELVEAVDAVSVSLPPDVQAQVAARAAAAGRHLLLDKPLALTVEAADRVVAATQAGGVASVVFFTARFVPAVADWLAGLPSPDRLSGAQITWLGSIFKADSPYRHSVWRQERGALWDVGPHALAIALPALGPVADLVAVPGRRDTVHLVLTHRFGATSTVALSLTVPPAATRTAVSVYGEAGWSSMPATTWDVVDVMHRALAVLTGEIATGTRADRVDVRFARDVVAVLARAEAALGRS